MIMARLNTNPSLQITEIREEFGEVKDAVNFNDIKTGHFLIIKRNEDFYLALKISETSVFSFGSLMLTEIDSDTVVCYDIKIEIFSKKDLSDIKSYQLKPGEFVLNDESELIMALTESDPVNCRHSIWNFTKNNLEDINGIRSYHLCSNSHVYL